MPVRQCRVCKAFLPKGSDVCRMGHDNAVLVRREPQQDNGKNITPSWASTMPTPRKSFWRRLFGR